MPHDRNGRPIKIGDLVFIPVIVTGVDHHDEFINLATETVEPMFPGEHKTPLLLNCRQVEIISPVVSDSPNLENCHGSEH